LVTGESIVSPRAKKGLFPLAIPLARNCSGIDECKLWGLAIFKI